MTTTNPHTGWQVWPTGRPHTTRAGRLAIPLELTRDRRHIENLTLVLDGSTAEVVHAAVRRHLEGVVLLPGPLEPAESLEAVDAA